MTVILLALCLAPQDRDTLIRDSVRHLLALQDADGSWPYEGGYRLDGDIPPGYRVGGTANVAIALHLAAPKNDAAKAAVRRARDYVLKELAEPALAASTAREYDVRIWGQAYALDFLSRLPGTDADIRKLVRILVDEELKGGGWTYAFRKHPASFVTAPVAQALLRARARGIDVPKKTLNRARTVLESARGDAGAFLYVGVFPASAPRIVPDKLPGSAARAALCETTIKLLGGGSQARIGSALDAFHRHWDELEKRRKQRGAHAGTYEIAPYYFYFGHRYAAQAIAMLPEARRPAERRRLLALLLRTRDTDGTWNDRTYARSRNYGTAMALIALVGEEP